MRYLFGFICVMMLGVAGCGEEEMKMPCEERTDCGALVKVDGNEVLADNRCAIVLCNLGVCKFVPLYCSVLTNSGCRRVEFTACNPDAVEPCGTLTPINEGEPCRPNCGGYFCHDGECVCDYMLCLCRP